MQLRHLKYFIAVAEAGSFIRAGRRLHVAQPSISKQIHDLEREIGCQLFDRFARGVRLTPAGHVFLAEARSTVENATRAVMLARSAQDQARNRLNVAFGRSSYYPPLVTELLTRFRGSNAECEMRMRSMTDRQQISGLRDRLVSVAITWTMDSPSPEFSALRLFDCSLNGVLLPVTHPLAQQSYISLSQLQPLTRLHNSRRVASELYRGLRKALLARGLSPARHRACSSDVTSLAMHIAAGDAYSLANDFTARAYTSANDGLVFRRFAEAAIPMWLTMYWRSDETSAHVQDLVRVALEVTRVPQAVA